MTSTVVSLDQQYHQAQEQQLLLKYYQQKQQQKQQQYNIRLGKVIGSGKTSDVYQCMINDSQFAVKQYKENHIKFLKGEVHALSQIAHPNIAKFYKQINKNSILMEFLPNGEVFDYIKITNGQFPKELAKFYSLQLSHAIEFIHANNFAHLDIKLENCLFDGEYNLKLADFGFATPSCEGKWERRFIGTHRYMSPEIENEQAYNAQKADIFALGCVIFILELGFQPIYERATDSDEYYKYFAYGAYNQFWKWLEKSAGQRINPDFKDLINHMLCKDVSQRYTIQQVLSHRYFQGCKFDKQTRVMYMDQVKQQIQQQ